MKNDFPSLDAFLTALPTLLPQNDPRLQGYNNLFRLETTDGMTRNIRVANGTITLPAAADIPYDCTLSVDSKLLLDIINGKANAVKAILFGKVKVKGNPASLLSLLKLL